MRCLALPAVKTVEKLNLADPDQSAFLFDLAHACRDYYFNDYESDIILLLHHAHQMLMQGLYLAFLCKVDGKPIGIIWVEKSQYDIGYIRCGISPEYRNGVFAKYFLKQFIDFCFTSLNLRKLVATFTLDQKPIEVLLRALGFTKEGFLREEMMKNGQPLDQLRLALTRTKYMENQQDG